jgi:hypothetical protein
LCNFITAFTHQAAVLLSMIGVTFLPYGPPSSLGSSRHHQRACIFRLVSGRLAIAALTIDKMVVSTIDGMIERIYSSSPARCHANTWVLFSPTLYPATWGSTEAMIKINGSTWKSGEAPTGSFIHEHL